jgi:hypothetical protein
MKKKYSNFAAAFHFRNKDLIFKMAGYGNHEKLARRTD